MRTVDIIAKKRDGKELTHAEIAFFIDGFTRGEIPDYQAAAWLMAVLWRGMTDRETVDLTLTMARSGEILDLSDIGPMIVDKHSTGGVGDKTTIAIGPLVTASGLPMAKMSGRGLEFSGGTLDKLESIPGYKVPLTREEFLEQVRRVGLAVAGQTGDLVPADGKLYALRDVTATVESIPLIASSIMSKKIASGANAIVLDVKVGRGAFMHTEADAVELAEKMVAIGQGVGRQVTAVVSDMSQPLGQAVGNALEVEEAIATLRGEGPADFTEHCMVIAAHLLVLGGKAQDTEEARVILRNLIDSGAALEQFRRWIEAQGGDPAVADDPKIMPQANLVRDVPAPRSGMVAGIDAMEVGLTAVALGAGREKKGDPIDHSVGIVFGPKIGDRVEAGERLLAIHAADEDSFELARRRLLAAYTWSDQPVEPPPLFHQVINGDLTIPLEPEFQ
ncbi:MAG: pyrimidine-nucleoside phosphorylase [Anaerolineae bacterium]